jgi:hypothetical protein
MRRHPDDGLIGAVLDHAHEQMGFSVRATDLKPSYRDRATHSNVSNVW